MKELSKSLLVTLLTTAIALLCAEAAFRIVSGKKVFALTRYRAANIVLNEFPKNVMSYDPQLGWRMNSGIGYPTAEQIALHAKAPRFHTIDFGVRRNSANDAHPQTGGILVSGASFTAGAEVDDEDAWPAQLETLIGRPVVNGAVGGFGADQIVLRAEELLPAIKPKILVIDLVQDNIATAGYSYSGYPKPYFTVEGSRLVLRNSPVPRYEPREDPYESLKNILSYSLIIDRIMATYFPDSWYSSRTQNFTRANNDEVNVSCLLLRRLKKEADDAGVRLLITMQYGGGTIMNTSTPDGNVSLLEECIGRMGIQYLDEFTTLKDLSRKNINEFRSLYVINNGILGHKSRAGNLAVAKMVAAALALPAPAVSAPPQPEAEGRDQGQTSEVIIGGDELASRFQSNPDAKIAAKGTSPGGRVFRVVAAGKKGEHYVVATLPGDAGRLTLSLEAKADTSSNVRLQLFRNHNAINDGVMGNFDLARRTAGTRRLGLATDIEASISPVGDGWYKLSMTATLPPESGQNMAIIQLADSQGNYGFDADGDAVIVRDMTIEQSGLQAKRQVNAVDRP
jgi:hypothetical protein